MSFSSSLHPVFLLMTLALGAWLAYGLYLRPSGTLDFMPRRWRWPLALLTVVAWLILGGLLVQPLWNAVKALYRVPVIVLAVDQSPSYDSGATLNSKEEVRSETETVRSFYQKKGFRVLDVAFGETAKAAGSPESVGSLSSLASVHHYLDSLATPNLQGIFLWTDGRFNLDTEASLQGWPAAVFPVALPGGRWNEVQGERALAELSDSGAELTVEWRNYGMGAATLELQSNARTFRKEKLPAIDAPDAPQGEKLLYRFHVPSSSGGPAVFRGAGTWRALIRPEHPVDNLTEKNDTVSVQFSGLRPRRQVFLRPLQSLEERGMVDALLASDSLEVIAVAPESLESQTRHGDVIWARSEEASRALRAAVKTGISVLLYELPSQTTSKAAFSATAHVQWREDGRRFLPAGILSLADLGGADLKLPPLNSQGDSSLEPLVWAEGEGRRGLLLGRRKNSGTPVFELSTPSFWSSQFRSDADDRVHRLQAQWLEGVAEWVRLQGERVQVETPALLLANRSFNLTVRLFSAEEGAQGSGTQGSTTHWELRAQSLERNSAEESLQAVDSKEPELQLGPLSLSAGRHVLALYSNGQRVWGDTVRVRDAVEVETSRLGIDRETLLTLALGNHGKLLQASEGKFGDVLPDLPRGQIQETHLQSHALFPSGVFTLILIALLSLVWALRKKHRLD